MELLTQWSSGLGELGIFREGSAAFWAPGELVFCPAGVFPSPLPRVVA